MQLHFLIIYVRKSMVEKMFEIKTFVFFDTETTGLPRLEQTPTKLTELAFVACSREHLLTVKKNEIPRVLHKLVLQVHPMKLILPGTTDITGIFFSFFLI